MSAFEDLTGTVAELQRVYKAVHAQLADNFPNPTIVVDVRGRYLLLDALTALAQAQTALLNTRPDEGDTYGQIP